MAIALWKPDKSSLKLGTVMPMRGTIPGSETEAALKAEGLYIPDILAETMRDKLGVIMAVSRKYAAKPNEIMSDLRVKYWSDDGYKYTAYFTLPYNKDVTTEDATYRAFVQRFQDAGKDVHEEGKKGISKNLNINWERLSDTGISVAIDSNNFEDLLKAAFDLQINPMIEAANNLKTPPATYKTVDWKQLIANDEAGLYNPQPLGPHTAAQLQRREDRSEDGPSK